MRVISIREFSRTLFKQVQDLPVIVTRRNNKKLGHPVSDAFVVIPYREDLIVSKDASDIELTRKEEKKGFLGGLFSSKK